MSSVVLKDYIVQTDRNSPEAAHLFNVPRVDYPSLLDELSYPILWVLDPLLEAWLPVETDSSFVKWLRTLPKTFDLSLQSEGRRAQLFRHMLVEPLGRPTAFEMKMEFERLGFVRIPQMLNGSYTKKMMKSYYFRNDHLHERWPDMPGIKRTSANDMHLMRVVHQATERLVNYITGRPLKTSYSFTAAYEHGSTLPAHTDRPQCVFNISLMLGSDPANHDLSAWPLYIRTKDGETHAVCLEPGDGVLYSGVEDLHWRNQMPSSLNMVLGVFFHYVPRDFEGSLA